MISLPLGFILTLGILIFSAGEDSLGLYTNAHSIVLVIGGSVAILLLSSPLEVIGNLFFALKTLGRSDRSVNKYKADFDELSKNKRLSNPSEHPLINYAAELWEQGINQDLFVVLLSQRRQELEQRTLDGVQALRNLSKYPPALGMTGTVMGMVSIFASMDDNKSSIGPALALAMTATFFGLIMANMLFMPLADRLQVKHLKETKVYLGVYQILLLIGQDEPTSLIQEEVQNRAS